MIDLGKDEKNNNDSIDVEFQKQQTMQDMNAHMGTGQFDPNQSGMNNMQEQGYMGNDMHQGNMQEQGYMGNDMHKGNMQNMNGMNQGYAQNINTNNQGYNQMNQGHNNGMQNNYGQMNQGMNQGNMQNNYQNPQMGYNQGGINNQMGGYNSQPHMGGYEQMQGQQGQQQYAQNNYGQMNQGMNQGFNMGMQSQDNAMAVQGEMSMEEITGQVSEYKQRLRSQREVQALTNEVNIQDTTSIINFGQKASDNISKISDELLNSMKAVKAEEASEMLTNLTKIMDKFDVKEIENTKANSAFSKLFKNMGNTVAKLFQKYDTMGYEVQKVYVLLKKYENDIKEANGNLKRLYDGNLEYYKMLEKYIVAGEMAIEEVDMYLSQIPNDQSMNMEEKQMLIQKLEISKDMLSQRVYDLQIAENVAIQAAPMIQTIQMSNFNLMRKINSSFIITLPIFKQCLAQAVILKRQEIQAKSIKQLDDKTNELIMRNATNTARQSVEIAKMSSGSSIQIETLQKSFETIMKGIEDTKAIQSSNRQQRQENSVKLEQIKANMKRNISES